VPWICAYTGARVKRGHAAQARRLRHRGGIRHLPPRRRCVKDGRVQESADTRAPHRTGPTRLREIPRKATVFLRSQAVPRRCRLESALPEGGRKTCRMGAHCRGGIPPLTREQAEFFHAQAPDWQLAEGKAHRLERRFRFRGAYLPSKYPRIDSRLRSLEAHTQTITAPPPRHYR
jgi:hypothetical protein